MKNNYLDQLNEQQRDAVLHMASPQLVIAGAGSGKTRVLTYKIIHLLAMGYNPARILALTFTNKAAKEMKERISVLMGEALTRKLWMGTFHSMFLRLLRVHHDMIGYRAGFTIYDASDSKALVKSIIKDMDLDDKVYKPGVVQNAISMAKNALISPDAYASDRDLLDIDRRSRKPLIHAIYRTYQNRCRIANVMDFDDILFYTNILLKNNIEIRNHYREFFQYVLVDEYQDTNYAQHVIIRMLTEGQKNLMVVGDDAQSIYSFRGAKIANILRLKDSYPDIELYKLERNYRSTQNIIEAANSLIEKNTRQIKKHIYSEKEKGNLIEILKSYSDLEEGYLIANKVSSSKHANHDSFSDYAILYRTNAQSRILEESLRKRNIPYKIYGGLSFYQRKEIKDAIAYFRVSTNPFDDEAIRRIINVPSRGIGDTTISKLSHAAIENGVSMWEMMNDNNIQKLNVNAGTRRKLIDFRTLIEEFISLNEINIDAYEVATTIIKKTGLLSILLSDRTPESISKQENLNELLNGVKGFVENRIEEGDEEHKCMNDYLSEVSLVSDIENSESVDGDSVSMMTVHAAKGLEFRNVFIVGVEEELFPAALSSTSIEDIEEERRLLYVAITRAKEQCVISYAGSRYRNGQTTMCRPSRFLGDIDSRYIKHGGGNVHGNLSFQSDPVQRYKEERHLYNSNKSGFNGRLAHEYSSKILNNTQVGSEEFSLHSLNELSLGQLIEHNRFGKGKIVNTEVVENNERIVVEFEREGTKTLLLKFARFKLID